MILKMSYLMIDMYSIPIDAVMIRLLGATIVLMHETIRITNTCHSLDKGISIVSEGALIIFSAIPETIKGLMYKTNEPTAICI